MGVAGKYIEESFANTVDTKNAIFRERRNKSNDVTDFSNKV